MCSMVSRRLQEIRAALDVIPEQRPTFGRGLFQCVRRELQCGSDYLGFSCLGESIYRLVSVGGQ